MNLQLFASMNELGSRTSTLGKSSKTAAYANSFSATS
jgi:hypothetical protein